MNAPLHYFFCLESGSMAKVPGVDDEYEVKLWRPSLLETHPKGVWAFAFPVWWLMHWLRMFSNREYSVLVLYRNGRAVHRSSVYPRFFRFPFMGPADLQIGNTYTEPTERGRGLAMFAIGEIVQRFAEPGRRFWYLVDARNAASVRAVERAGFSRVGVGCKEARFGVRLLGRYSMSGP
jgi:RimJ/RimL family protein N-acetyltransferase